MPFGISDRDLSLVATGYLKRWLERRYDHTMETPFGQFLLGLDPASKHGLELALYALTALIDRRMDESTPLTVILKQISMDAGPELAKRVLNGDSVAESSMVAVLPQPAAGFMNTLLTLPPEQRADVLDWLSTFEPPQRQAIFQTLDRVSREVVLLLVQANPAHRQLLLDFILSAAGDTTATTPSADQLAGNMATLRQRLRRWRRGETE